MRRTIASLVAAALAVPGLIVVAPGASAAIGNGPISISDYSHIETNVNGWTFRFNIGGPNTVRTGCTIDIPWSTTGGGTATPGSDYEAASGTGRIVAGASYVSDGGAHVEVFSDTTVEPDETFNVVLGTPTTYTGTGYPPCDAATVADGTAVGTIVNDDSGPSASPSASPSTSPSASTSPSTPPVTSALSINDVNRSAGACTFTVSLAPSSTSPVMVDFAAADADGDATFTPTSGTLTFAPGNTLQEVVVSSVKKRRRASELEVNLSGATGASITDANGTCSIPKKRHH
jgi:chitinase